MLVIYTGLCNYGRGASARQKTRTSLWNNTSKHHYTTMQELTKPYRFHTILSHIIFMIYVVIYPRVCTITPHMHVF